LKNQKYKIATLFLIAFFIVGTFIPMFMQNPATFMQVETLPDESPLNSLNGDSTPWWNKAYRYRLQVNISEPNIATRTNEPVDIWINFTDYSVTTGSVCGNNSIRVLYYSGSSWIEINSQVWNRSYHPSNNITEATITFPVNITQNTLKSYYIYYNETGTEPVYVSNLVSTYDAGTEIATINNGIFEIKFTDNNSVHDLIYDSGTVRDYHLNASLSPLGPTVTHQYGSQFFYAYSTEWVELTAYEPGTIITIYDSAGVEVNTTTLAQYESTRYPYSGTLSAGLYEITANNPISTVVSSVDPLTGGSGDDEVWSAYDTKILGRIYDDIWVSSYEDGTEISIYDVSSGTPVLYQELSLDEHGSWYNDTPSAYNAYEVYLFESNKPIAVVAGYSNGGMFTGIYGKDQMQFKFPSPRTIGIIAEQPGTTVDYDDGKGNTGSTNLDRGEFFEIDSGNNNVVWGSINSTKPIRIFVRHYGNTGTAVGKTNAIDTEFFVCDPGGGVIRFTATEDDTSVIYNETDGSPYIIYTGGTALDKGDTITQSISSRGVHITSDKPIFVQYWDNGVPTSTSMYIPRPTQPSRINDIQVIENGSVFTKYQLTWENFGGMNTTDVITVYADYELYRIERKIWFNEEFTNSSFRVIDTYYNNTHFDEYVYDDILHGSSLDNPDISAENYTVIHDQDSDLMTIGLFLSAFETNGSVNLTTIDFAAEYRDQVSHIYLGNNTDLETPVTSTANDYALFTLWELAKHLINPNPDIYAIDDKLFNPLQISSLGDEQSLFYNLILSFKDIDGLDSVGLTCFLNNTDSGDTVNYTDYSDGSGQLTFARLEEGNFTLNVTYEDFGTALPLYYNSSIELNTTTTSADGELTMNIYDLHITHFDISLVSYPDLLELNSANVTFFNTTDGSSYDELGIKQANPDGTLSFYWRNTTGVNWNYTLNVSFYGSDRKIRLQPDSYDETEWSTLTGVVQTGTIINAGDNNSLVSDDDDAIWVGSAAGVGQETNLTANVSSIPTTNLIEIDVNIRCNYSLASVDGDAWIYDWVNSEWDYLMDINSSTSETEYNSIINTSAQIANVVSGSGDIWVMLNSSDAVVHVLGVDLIDFDLLYSTNSWDWNYNFTLANYTSDTIEASLSDFSTELVNFSSISQTVDYGQNLTFTVRYNYTIPGDSNHGLTDANFFLQISEGGQVVNTSLLSMVGDTGANEGNYTIEFNSSDSTLDLATGVTYIFYIEASKPNYETKALVYQFELNAISSNLYVQLNETLFWGQNLTVIANYTAAQGEISGATLTYNWAGNVGELTMNDTDPNNVYYIAEINTSIVLYGYQTIYISAVREHYESQINKDFSFTLNERSTKLNNSDEIFYEFSFYALEANNISFNYTDVLSGGLVADATATFKYNSIDYDLDNLGNGYYVLDFDTETREVGNYVIGINIKKTNYSQPICIVQIHILSRPTILTPTQGQISVEQGNAVTFSFTFVDQRNGTFITPSDAGVTLWYSWAYGNSTLTANLVGEVYTVTLDLGSLNAPVGTYTIQIGLMAENYTISTLTVTLVVGYLKILGIDWPIFLAILITAIIAISAVVGYVGVKRARIPYEIKKIDETYNGIKKKKGKLPYPILKTKDEIYEETFGENWALLELKPPLKGKKAAQDDFIDLVSSIKKIKMTAYEAETLKAKLVALSHEEAIKLLAEMGIPPDTAERIIQLAKK